MDSTGAYIIDPTLNNAYLDRQVISEVYDILSHEIHRTKNATEDHNGDIVLTITPKFCDRTLAVLPTLSSLGPQNRFASLSDPFEPSYDFIDGNDFYASKFGRRLVSQNDSIFLSCVLKPSRPKDLMKPSKCESSVATTSARIGRLDSLSAIVDRKESGKKSDHFETVMEPPEPYSPTSSELPKKSKQTHKEYKERKVQPERSTAKLPSSPRKTGTIVKPLMVDVSEPAVDGIQITAESECTKIFEQKELPALRKSSTKSIIFPSSPVIKLDLPNRIPVASTPQKLQKMQSPQSLSKKEPNNPKAKGFANFRKDRFIDQAFEEALQASKNKDTQSSQGKTSKVRISIARRATLMTQSLIHIKLKQQAQQPSMEGCSDFDANAPSGSMTEVPMYLPPAIHTELDAQIAKLKQERTDASKRLQAWETRFQLENFRPANAEDRPLDIADLGENLYEKTLLIMKLEKRALKKAQITYQDRERSYYMRSSSTR